MAQQWDGTHTAANIVLNGSPLLTATKITSSNYNSAFSLISATSGKYYWEIIASGSGVAGNGVSVGIGNIASVTTDGVFAGSTVDTIGWFGSNGDVYNNGAIATNWGGYTSGQTICVALDLANNMIWGRVTNGNWNANASADPATGTLGFIIPSAVYAAAVVPCATVFFITTPDVVVGVFSNSSWTYTAPGGFTSFDFSAWARPAVSFFR